MSTRTAHYAGPHGAGFRQRLGALLHAIAAWNDARATRRALRQLSDRELEDIGLSRADIERIR